MRHINKIIIQQAADSRGSSSCGSDVDRQELITSYGNDKYLSKWGLDEQEIISDNKPTKDDQLLRVTTISSEKEDVLLVDQEDNTSLVSYNSVRDGVQTKPSTSCLPYQVNQPSQDITLWQGYSGNIYFDSVRCRSLRINSSKPNNRKPKQKKTHRLTKSCSPSIEFHPLNNTNHAISCSASSFHSLGSLRISSRQEKKAFPAHKTFPQYSKLRKGFVVDEKRDTPTSPAELVVCGGQVNEKTDPIDGVYRLNTKRLSSRGRSETNFVENHFPSAASSRCIIAECTKESNTRLPFVGRTACISEPKHVFIIPFATLDDPVEVESIKYDKKSSIVSEDEDNYSKPVKLGAKKPVKQDNTKKPVKQDKPKLVKPVSLLHNTGNTCIKDLEVQKLDVKTNQKEGVYKTIPPHIVNITGEANKSPREITDFNVRRDISNSSLSNYLKAVPQKTCKNSHQEARKMMPKLTYTQRNNQRELPTNGLNNNNQYQQTSLGETTALYGGYLPANRPQDFQVELSSDTCSDESEVKSPFKKDTLKSIYKGNKGRGAKTTKKCHFPDVIGWKLS